MFSLPFSVGLASQALNLPVSLQVAAAAAAAASCRLYSAQDSKGASKFCAAHAGITAAVLHHVGNFGLSNGPYAATTALTADAATCCRSAMTRFTTAWPLQHLPGRSWAQLAYGEIIPVSSC